MANTDTNNAHKCSLVGKEMQRKISGRYHYTPIRKVNVRNIDDTEAPVRLGASGSSLLSTAVDTVELPCKTTPSFSHMHAH